MATLGMALTRFGGRWCATAAEALALPPDYVGERASVTRVDEIEIP
jgi:hypothetical protein